MNPSPSGKEGAPAPEGLPPGPIEARVEESRYRLGPEIASGGLGRVVEAFDWGLDREVALKLVLDDLPPDLARRFEREAKLTARLDHPHIVPIYDFGLLPDSDGRRRLFLCMKRIQGRDLGMLLRALADGDSAARRDYSRARLLSIFQDICLGMAFAHSRGVIHRDLKPSNIMIGDFGETFIVDWGIAKTLQDPPPESESAPTASGPRVSGRKPTLTIEGEILGTPAYMSPEQADGLNAVLDVRSDIFSLGAILYEILTLRPAFEGLTAEEVMDKVRFGAVTPPGARLLQVRAERQLRDSRLAAAGSPIRTVADDFPGPVPAELDSICMKAMARTKEDRYAGAMELHREVQLFLEGVKERERAGRESRELVQAGNRHLERFRELQWTIESQRDAIVELRDCIRPHESLEAKRNLWAAESRLRALEEERIGEFTQANAAFGQALIVDAGNSEASIGKCELFLDGYLEAEQRRDRKGMILHRNTLAQYDRGGRYRARLETPGRLTLRTWEYECECARPVQDRSWRVEFGGEPEIPWRSGRPLPGTSPGDHDRPVPVVRLSSSTRPGHGPDCRRREVTGVEVYIARYEEREKRLLLGPGRRLGETPLVETVLPRGSWRCTLRRAAGEEIHVPVRIQRGETWEQEVTLYPESDRPGGFQQVSAGRFIFGGEYAGGAGETVLLTGDFFLARSPVTCGEYIEYLNDLAAGGRAEEARRRQPREGDRHIWIEEAGPAAGPVFRFPRPEEDPAFVWDPRWPLFSINWFDAMAYCAWRSEREGRLYTPPHEEEFEKAARGVDGRVYPFGDEYDASFSHTILSLAGKMRPLPVGSFPADESPYGVLDLAGEVATWCFNSPEVPGRAYRALRGGAWSNSERFARSAFHEGNLPPTRLTWDTGLRLCWRPQRL